jgi:hypothetical protein
MEQQSKNIFSPDDVLQSIEGIHRAEAPCFFYTRLMGRMQAPVTAGAVWIRKPVFSFATLLILLVLNITAISHFLGKEQPAAVAQSGIQGFASEYGLDGSSSYQDKNDQ